MIIIGGGYIACEFASIFNGFGVEVTLLYRGDRILRGFDDDIRENIEVSLIRKGIKISNNCYPTLIKLNNKMWNFLQIITPILKQILFYLRLVENQK